MLQKDLKWAIRGAEFKMRLICPNCGAQYDVPDDVMPPEGRDVQCSNCSETWFQAHPEGDAEQSSPPAPVVEEPTEVTAPRNIIQDAPPEPADQEAEKDALATVEDVPPVPARKSLDPAIVSVLQEEAEFEVRARQNQETGPVETQPDLGLNDTEETVDTRNRAREAGQRIARMLEDDARSAPVKTTPASTATSETVGTPLPDIEEINSTLRSNEDRSPEDDPGQTAQFEARERQSFGRGFFVMVILAALLTLIYILAPEIANALPQAEPGITAYVEMVDGWRAWLDGQFEGLLTWLDTAASSGSS